MQVLGNGARHGRACSGDARSAIFHGMPTPRFSVVYADDDPLMREAITDALTQEGVDVHACESGVEALALCELIHPDAVLLDLNMPEATGLEIARELRLIQKRAGQRLVALTGHDSAELRRKAAASGFDQFLSKPVETQTLLRALRPS
jgi:CheY-like chemotaxis protein